MIKNTAAALQKVERILSESGYILRYERGTFQSGYCILEEKKVVVLNKFLDMEGRIQILHDLIPNLIINIDAITHDSQKLYHAILSKQDQLL